MTMRRMRMSSSNRSAQRLSKGYEWELAAEGGRLGVFRRGKSQAWVWGCPAVSGRLTTSLDETARFPLLWSSDEK